MTQERLHSILSEAGLTPDAQGFAVYDCEGLHINVECYGAGEGLYLYCGLGKLPAEPPRALYEWALETNFLGLGACGGHVGLHKATRTLTYSLRLEGARVDARSLRNALHLFAGNAVGLIEALGAAGNTIANEAARNVAPQLPVTPVVWG